MNKDRIKLNLDTKKTPMDITWIPSINCLTVKLNNKDVDLSIDLDSEAIKQITQALSWSGVKK